MVQEPEFTIGIEEEYLLVDTETCALAEAPEALMEACIDDLGEQVSPEFLQCQIEIGTRVCAHDRRGARRPQTPAVNAWPSTQRPMASRRSRSPATPSPTGRSSTTPTRNATTGSNKDLGGVARRMLICGMHVHVGIDDHDLRIDLMNQFTYFLPHLLALSRPPRRSGRAAIRACPPTG